MTFSVSELPDSYSTGRVIEYKALRMFVNPPANASPSANATAVVNGACDLARLIRAPCPHSIRLTAAKYVATSRSPGAQAGLVTAANTPAPIATASVTRAVSSQSRARSRTSSLPCTRGHHITWNHTKRGYAIRWDRARGSEIDPEQSNCGGPRVRRPSSDRDRHDDRDHGDQHRRRRQQAESGRL